MKFELIEFGAATFGNATCLVIPCMEKGEHLTHLDSAEESALRKLEARGLSLTKASAVHFVSVPDHDYAGILTIGVGDFEHLDAEVLRRAAGAACATLRAQKISSVVLDLRASAALPVEAIIEGIMLGQYDFTEFKQPPEEAPTLVDELYLVLDTPAGSAEIQAGCERAIIECESTNWARDLANTPPTHMTPIILAERARAMAEETGATCTILDETEMHELGMEALLGVARGSKEPPRLIVLEYNNPDSDVTLAMVGKGITFDTGGISIKPADAMHEMKYDMCGSTAVLGAMRTICMLKPAINVVCVVPTSENKTGADAIVPGDILRAYNGKTIEVLNTDAEGRLILADALAYTIDKFDPDAVVDAATLTGACVVALGHYMGGLFSNHDDLAQDLLFAGDASGDLLWPLPITDDYSRLMKGTHADLTNAGPRGEAGAITAACFLKEFVGETPWAHLDIAGTAWGGKHISYLDPNHASGFGVRLFTQWILDAAMERAHQGDEE